MKNDGLLNRSITKMLRQFPSWRTTSRSGSTSTALEREEAWLVKQASALLTDVEAGILASNCVICNDKRGWKPADDSDAGSTPPILCWKLAFSLELQLKARGRGSGMWDLRSRKNRTHDLKIVWDSLLNVDKDKARQGLKQYANMSTFDGKLETVRNAYKDFQYLTDSPHRDCKKALRSLVLLNMGFMKGCYDKPRFINVETGLLNVKTLALDDFTVAERTVLKECERKGFIVVARVPGSTALILDADTPERNQGILQPKTPKESRVLLEAIRSLERIHLLEQCGQIQYNNIEQNVTNPATVWELTKVGFEACRKPPEIIATNDVLLDR